MSSPGNIVPNFNVNAKGEDKPLPTARKIASGEYDWLCAILEVLAARLHHEAKGTTASTSTIGLISEVGCLFLTSQANSKFDGVELSQIHDWIGELAKVDYDGFLKTIGVSQVYELPKEKVQGLQSKKDSESKKMVETINFVYYNLYPSFLRLQWIKKAMPECFGCLSKMITSVKVITTDMLAPRSTITSGLHGEGRFVRFCYIHYVKDLTLLEKFEMPKRVKVVIPAPSKILGATMQPTLTADVEMGEEEDESVTAYRQYQACMLKLKKQNIEVMKIFVASSQGTCKDCQVMLTELNIAHNTHRYSKESASPNWVDPFTWKDKNSSSRPSPYLSATQHGKMLAEKEAESINAAKRSKQDGKTDT